jgi:nucleoid DNA-binding protein
MTKSELIDALAVKHSHLAFNDVESAVKIMLVHMIQTWLQVKELRLEVLVVLIYITTHHEMVEILKLVK